MAGKLFYAAMAAGIAFIVIGAASSIYANVAVDVPLDNKVRPGASDIITPDMNAGNMASISVSGSRFNIKIEDPQRQVIRSETNATSFTYDLTAEKSGEYRMEILNTGDSELAITGHAQTKSSPLELSGALMLMITGIVVIGLGLRFRKN